MSSRTCRASTASPFTSMIHISGFCAAMSARWNSSEKGLMRSRSRTCLALLPMVLLATPNASLSWSAVTYGWLAGSNRKFAWYPAEAKALAWMERTSLPLGHLQDPRVTRRALDSLTLRLNGTQATPHTIVRKRAVFHNARGAVGGTGRVRPGLADRDRRVHRRDLGAARHRRAAPAAGAAADRVRVRSPGRLSSDPVHRDTGRRLSPAALGAGHHLDRGDRGGDVRPGRREGPHRAGAE